MARVTMYCTGICPYCLMAERLLHSKGIKEIDKIRVDLNPKLRDEMTEKTQKRTVPQIYIGDVYVGGFDALSSLDRSGKLNALLQADVSLD